MVATNPKLVRSEFTYSAFYFSINLELIITIYVHILNFKNEVVSILIIPISACYYLELCSAIMSYSRV